MSMTKRVQIPVDPVDLALLKSAAKRAGMPLAEWARGLLRDKAREQLESEALTPVEAFAQICRLDAPVAEVDIMIEQSLQGRLT